MMELRRIFGSDIDWHSRFFQFVAAIFPGLDAERWQLWYDRGGWPGNYEVFAIVDGAQIISTIGRTRMTLVVNDETRVGYQLGAVATLAPYRRQGLTRRVMSCVIDGVDDPGQPIILFGNNSVLDFYPRFGFRRIPQRRSTARVSIKPFGAPAARFDPASAADRSRLADLCARARSIRGPLAARDYYSVLSWHLSCRPVTAVWLPEFDAILATTAEGERLLVHDVVSVQPFDLSLVIPTLITHPISELEFHFDSEDWWPTAIPFEFDDAHSPLFARGCLASIAGPVSLPDLAHT